MCVRSPSKPTARSSLAAPSPLITASGAVASHGWVPVAGWTVRLIFQARGRMTPCMRSLCRLMARSLSAAPSLPIMVPRAIASHGSTRMDLWTPRLIQAPGRSAAMCVRSPSRPTTRSSSPVSSPVTTAPRAIASHGLIQMVLWTPRLIQAQGQVAVCLRPPCNRTARSSSAVPSPVITAAARARRAAQSKWLPGHHV